MAGVALGEGVGGRRHHERQDHAGLAADHQPLLDRCGLPPQSVDDWRIARAGRDHLRRDLLEERAYLIAPAAEVQRDIDRIETGGGDRVVYDFDEVEGHSVPTCARLVAGDGDTMGQPVPLVKDNLSRYVRWILGGILDGEQLP